MLKGKGSTTRELTREGMGGDEGNTREERGLRLEVTQ
jgi:hypothetical protein